MHSQKVFFNPSQPQTLQIGVMLLYLNAAFDLLFGSLTGAVFGPIIGLLIVAALALGAFGIANEKKWGYALGVAAAVVRVVVLIWVLRGGVFNFPYVITLLFDGALVALLLHPQSRDYQRIWFR
ncbi:MAG: hypothetical protein JWL73_1891 [Actinomycetia bacterium]|nr:hypothetical protein [Actinomycetes bacterium]